MDGHDHLMAGPGSHGDFNVAWVPTLVLFTSTAFANQHLVTERDVETAVDLGHAIEVPLDGTNGTPNLTFHCRLSGRRVRKRRPFTGRPSCLPHRSPPRPSRDPERETFTSSLSLSEACSWSSATSSIHPCTRGS